MPFNGAGVFTRIYSWIQDANNGLDISSTRMDTDTDDIAQGLSTCMTIDGQSTPTANLPMGSFKLTGLANGSANGDSINYGQVYTDTGTFAALKTFQAGYTVSGGTVTMTAATSVLVPTATLGDSSTKAATTAFVAGTAMSSALPGQLGNARKEIKTDGTTASWGFYDTFEERTSNTILAQADSRKFIDITSGTFSQTFTAAATLGDGWSCVLRNSGTGIITIPASDGLTNWPMYPGETRQFRCNGATFKSIVMKGFSYTFITVGANTFTKPPGYDDFEIDLTSGGNSGQRTNAAGTLSVGGGGGGRAVFRIPASDVGATETVTVGNGGAAVTTVANGNLGGVSSFGSIFTVYPGGTWYMGGSVVQNMVLAASGSQTTGVGYEGGAGNVVGGYTGATWGGSAASNDATQNSGNAVYGGAAGGSVDAAGTLRTAGVSRLAGDGGAASAAGNGVDGTAPGGGGGATKTGASSGAGARGEVRVRGIA